LFGHADDILVGGMSYELDPNLKAHGPIEPHHNGECGKRAAQMLECVRLGHEKVRAVRVRKVNVDIEFEDDECLD
jgi:zinc metalloprotease ZmpB